MSAFKRTEIIKHPESRRLGAVDDAWGHWEQPITIQEYGAINKIDISRHSPNYFAITGYSKVLIYNPVIKDVYKTLTKFQDAAFGAKFRKDGQLLCVGTSEGQLKIFDVATKTLLRILRGHSTAARRCDFTPDKTHVVSFSDDKTVRVWDLPSETLFDTFTGHDDYIRCGAAANVSSDLVLSGSYDQTIKLWDRRTNGEAVLTMMHGAPVEDVVILPGDSLVVSAGGNYVKIWDIAGGGRELASLSPHHKTVTCLCIADSGGTVVSGSLDRSAKRINMQNFQVSGSMSFPSSLLSVAVDADSKFLVGGMTDGLVQIFQKRQEYIDGVSVDSSQQAKNKKSHRYLKYTHFTPAPGDIIVDQANNGVELRHDQLLRKYEYSKALDHTLKPFVQRRTPQYAHSVFYELMRRDGLRSTLVGRDERALIPVLAYLHRYLFDTRFSKVLLHVADIVVDLYLPLSVKSNKVEKLFGDLLKKLMSELRLIQALVELESCLETVISSANAGQESSRIEKEIFKKSAQI